MHLSVCVSFFEALIFKYCLDFALKYLLVFLPCIYHTCAALPYDEKGSLFQERFID